MLTIVDHVTNLSVTIIKIRISLMNIALCHLIFSGTIEAKKQKQYTQLHD